MELEFRDGKRFVPEYLADLMGGLETYRMTYEQAINAVNNSLIGTHLYKAQDELIVNQLRENRR